MYLDKIYNKLYSAKDEEGLRIFLNEIKVFSDDEKDSAWSSLKKACKHGAKFIGKALTGLLAAGIPLAAAVAYLENSSNGRIFLKEHGFDYNMAKANLGIDTEKAKKDLVNDGLEIAGRKVKEATEPITEGVGSFLKGLRGE